ncbi:MAG: M20/M25/M40 family metallo-hydrolase [Candidatus Acidiferrales bacterium]
MSHRLLPIFYFLFSSFLVLLAAPSLAQAQKPPAVPGSLTDDLRELVETPAVSGYKEELIGKIRTKLTAFHPVVDNLGDVIVTLGSGSPHRLIVTPVDEPGFIISGITDDGYLRVQRLPQSGLPPVFNELYSAQPVKVRTTGGRWIDGVFAGLSVHLQPGRTNPLKSGDIENMYVDIGASSAAEVHRAGVDILSPIVINRRLENLGYGKMAGASIGDRFGAAALLELLRHLDPSKVSGSLTVAFVVQQRTGARGLQRILSTIQADEMIYVGRLLPGGAVAGVENIHRAPRREPGGGVLLGMEKTDGTPTGLGADLKQLAASNKIPFATDYSASMIPPGYLPPPPMPAKWAHIAVATAWPDTPAAMLDSSDLAGLVNLLEVYAQGSREEITKGGQMFREAIILVPPPGTAPPLGKVIRNLVESYGVSGHEGPVRDEVKSLLPPWAKTETDEAGNLLLHVGTAPAGSKTPRILVVAHMDEIGFVVKSISKDGRLEVEWRGNGDLSFYAGHPARVHSAGGGHDAIVELPNQWDEPNFTWPKESERAIRVDVGARTPEEVRKLGIKPGDTVTIPKTYRPLLGTRANGRSFDDRVGCTALISAVWALGGPLKDRDVTFVWSTREEIGLVGAAALAKRLAAEGRVPDYVFAVDTFVSSDSPLESKRFADAQLGKGFVVRAVDNSNIVPRDAVEKLVKLARANQIPVQYGVTGGGNDGSAFVRYGSMDIALGWPLRYSHSPAEVIDTRDVDALARIVTVIAKNW